jgi:hypothetical protein
VNVHQIPPGLADTKRAVSLIICHRRYIIAAVAV